MFKVYYKTAPQSLRPYIPGEDLSKISVNEVDTPELGGMIARNVKNELDLWYISKEYFEDNYRLAEAETE